MVHPGGAYPMVQMSYEAAHGWQVQVDGHLIPNVKRVHVEMQGGVPCVTIELRAEWRFFGQADTTITQDAKIGHRIVTPSPSPTEVPKSPEKSLSGQESSVAGVSGWGSTSSRVLDGYGCPPDDSGRFTQ